MMETAVCNLCGQDETRLVYQVQDNNYGCPGTFSLVQCVRCGLVYLNPRPAASEISAFYPVEQYHPFRAIHEGSTAVPAPLHTQRAHRLTAHMGPGHMLDVGCGSGLFLLAMQQQGWRVMGLEPNAAAAQFGRDALHLDVRTGDIFSLDTAVFDLITFWDVLEHTHSPLAVLQHAHQLLKPGGFLALNVPNWGSLERRLFRERWIALDAPRHLYHFTPQSLAAMLAVCGFEPERMEASAPPLSLSSNVLRWLGDSFLRKGKSKRLVAKEVEGTAVSGRTAVPSPSPAHQQLISLTYQMMRLPNAAANLLNVGAGVTIIAQKPISANTS